MNSSHKPKRGIPEETVQAARQLYNFQNVYILIGDHLNDILADVNMQMFNPVEDCDAEKLFLLSMVTAFQYAESLPDMMASDAMLKRVDWKYALHLPVYRQRFEPTAFCTFRQNLYSSRQGLKEFTRLLERLDQIGLYTKKTLNHLTSDTALLTVCEITRLHQLSVGMRSALSMLVAASPEWISANMPPYWFERYSKRSSFLLTHLTCDNMAEEAAKLGADMRYLLTALDECSTTSLVDRTAINQITRLFDSQFTIADGQLSWRLPGCEYCSRNSPKEFNT